MKALGVIDLTNLMDGLFEQKMMRSVDKIRSYILQILSRVQLEFIHTPLVDSIRVDIKLSECTLQLPQPNLGELLIKFQ